MQAPEEMKVYVGIDNGVTGSIGIVDAFGRVLFYAPTPVEVRQNYTKAKNLLKKVVPGQLRELLEPYAAKATVVLERPATSPKQGWNTIQSSIRCDEATVVVLEMLQMRYQYVDSRSWQKDMLPKLQTVPRAPKGATEEEKKRLRAARARLKSDTKRASLEAGRRLFPGVSFKGDADALLMAEWARINRK